MKYIRKKILLMTVLLFFVIIGKTNEIYAWENEEAYNAQFKAYDMATYIYSGNKDPNTLNYMLLTFQQEEDGNEYTEQWIQYLFAVGIERGTECFLENIDYMKTLGYWSEDYKAPEFIEPPKDEPLDGAWTFYPTNGISDCTAYTKTVYEVWTLYTARTDAWKLKSGCTPSTCKKSSVKYNTRDHWLLYHDDEKGEFVRTSIIVDDLIYLT